MSSLSRISLVAHLVVGHDREVKALVDERHDNDSDDEPHRMRVLRLAEELHDHHAERSEARHRGEHAHPPDAVGGVGDQLKALVAQED